MTLDEKEAKLTDILIGYGSVAVAWSGGVDSTFLSAYAHEVLEGRVLLINARSAAFPDEEAEFVEGFASARGIPLKVVETHELDNEDYKSNPTNRCYFCKTEMYGTLRPIAEEAGMAVLLDGANIEDFKSDFRPGHQAAEEWDVKHPLRDAEMTKADIRTLSKSMGLPTWDKPAFACLASRFPYGEYLDEYKLKRVADAETVMRQMNFKIFRVRSHDDLARIEIGEDEIERGFQERHQLIEKLKALGFFWVTIDMQGFRSGSMNEAITGFRVQSQHEPMA
ncbi:MAG: ATP-dependent sacrificial sulfur transferase LarE [Lentisphaeria bacterium]|nr:ATP-dependent sacrificial sulfur transferase LarE [Lentisphaeria bacterium]